MGQPRPSQGSGSLGENQNLRVASHCVHHTQKQAENTNNHQRPTTHPKFIARCIYEIGPGHTTGAHFSNFASARQACRADSPVARAVQVGELATPFAAGCGHPARRVRGLDSRPYGRLSASFGVRSFSFGWLCSPYGWGLTSLEERSQTPIQATGIYPIPV